MRLKIMLIVALLLVFSIAGPSAYAQCPAALSSTQLIEQGFAYNGTDVAYAGEVVGDILWRENGAWINVSDGVNALGVFIPTQEAEKIETCGGYRVAGDRIALTGTFHRDCAQHGGDMDIHADTITVTKRGSTWEDTPSKSLVLSAVVLFPCALAAVVVVLKKRT